MISFTQKKNDQFYCGSTMAVLLWKGGGNKSIYKNL